MSTHRRPPHVALRILQSLNVPSQDSGPVPTTAGGGQHDAATHANTRGKPGVLAGHQTRTEDKGGVSPLVAASFGRAVPLAEVEGAAR